MFAGVLPGLTLLLPLLYLDSLTARSLLQDFPFLIPLAINELLFSTPASATTLLHCLPLPQASKALEARDAGFFNFDLPRGEHGTHL